jgi:hypothetical protein
MVPDPLQETLEIRNIKIKKHKKQLLNLTFLSMAIT